MAHCETFGLPLGDVSLVCELGAHQAVHAAIHFLEVLSEGSLTEVLLRRFFTRRPVGVSAGTGS